MASFFLGINRGQVENLGLVTAATTTSATDFELRIDTGKSSKRSDVVKALRAFEYYMLSNAVPDGTPGVDLPPL